MNAAALLRSLNRRVPEFSADDLFLDLPYVVFGEFAGFVVDRLDKHGSDDPVVKRSFDFVNDLFFEGDPEMVNIIETTLFEQLADDSVVARAAHALLEPSAQTSFEQIAKWAGGNEVRPL
jgi:hypothetical protein